MPTRTLALVMALAAGCSEPAARIPVPPPLRTVLDPPGHGDFAHQSFPSPLPVSDAEQILLRTKFFAVGAMPWKRQVQAFNLVFEQPDALARFEALAARGEMAGKLYALCALLALQPDSAARLGHELSRAETKIDVADSDVWLSRTPAEMVAMVRERRLWEAFRRDKLDVTKYFEEQAKR